MPPHVALTTAFGGRVCSMVVLRASPSVGLRNALLPLQVGLLASCGLFFSKSFFVLMHQSGYPSQPLGLLRVYRR